MNFIISIQYKPGTEEWMNVTYVRLSKDQSFSEPATISREELIGKMRAGLTFRRLNKVGCTWEVGAEIALEKEKSGYQVKELSAQT